MERKTEQNGMEYEIMQERNKHDENHRTEQRTQNGIWNTWNKTERNTWFKFCSWFEYFQQLRHPLPRFRDNEEE